MDARDSLPRASGITAAALLAVALTTSAGAPAAMAMSPPAAVVVPQAASAPISSPAATPPPAPASEAPPGADTSATTPPMAPAVPPGRPAVTAAAGGDDQAPEPTTTSARPRFAMSIAVGISVDNHGIGDGRNVLVPSLAVQSGIGEGLVGFGLRLFASEAAGRFSSPSPAGKSVADLGADRQALDVLLNLRPFALVWIDAGDAWRVRFARALAVELGVAGERVSIGTTSTFREGVVVGGRLSLPVVRSVDGSELYVTIAVRRMLAAARTVSIGGTPQSVGDSKLEAFSGLSVSF